MLDFRKIVALTAASLGLAASAFGQAAPPTATLVAPNSNYVSIEGTTEVLPPIVFTVGPGASAGSNVYASVGSFSFTLTSNVPFTNIANATTGALDVFASDTTTAANADVGTVTQTSPTQVTVAFTIQPGTITGISVQGLRVNASLVPSPVITIAPGAVAAGGLLMASTTAQTAAYPVNTLNSVAVFGYLNTPLSNFPFTAAQSATDISDVAIVSFNGNVIGILKTAADYTAVYTEPTPAAAHPPTPTTPAQGTRLQVTFNNLNANVNYYVPATIGTAPLVLTAYTAATGTTAATVVPAGTAGAGLVALPAPVNGSTSIFYGVTTDGAPGQGVVPAATGNGLANYPGAPYAAAAGSLILSESVPAVTAVTAATTSPVSVSINLVGVGTGYPQFSATAPAYTAKQTTTAGGNGLLTLNTTTLLFPYVTELGGFDTGIAIANTSTVPSGVTVTSQTTSPAAGSCSLTFYGVGAPTTNPFSLGVVASGTLTPEDIGTIAPSFAGYIVASCNFSGAHGYAFLAGGTGNAVTSTSYLAVVLGDATLGTAGVTAQ